MNDSKNPSLAVSYEPIILRSHYNYRKKSFIEKLNIANQGKKDITDPSNLIEGTLIIDGYNQLLLFKPHEYGQFSDLAYYKESFQKKMTIPFNKIKTVIFINKNSEYITVKSSESVNKAYRSFLICCYDFRVFNFNRLGLYNKNDAIKFFQDIYRIIFEKNMNRYKYIMWKNLNPDVLFSVYYKTLPKEIEVDIKTVKNFLVMSPQELSNSAELFNNFEFGPQTVYYAEHNHSYLMVSDRSSDKKLKDILLVLSKKILDRNLRPPTIFFLNNGTSDTKSEFPTTKELNNCYEKLFAICTPRNKAEFKKSDKKWLTKLSDCGWLNLINRCFQLTKIILQSLTNSKSFVYLIENGYPVWGWLFGSLVQIICQPYVRTTRGFLAMIDKNWILSGAYGNSSGSKPQLFLLFLDCVYQLLRLSPFLFEFNEEMLICLYDLFILSPPGFMSSQDYEFKKFNWSKFFEDPVVDCLVNHYFNRNEEIDCCLNIPTVDLTDSDCFWFKMYARWIPYVQVEGGSIGTRHFFMIASIFVDTPVYSNYPFSLNYDRITLDTDDNNDDIRSINTVISDEL